MADGESGGGVQSVDTGPRIDDLGPHDHACWVFGPDDDHDDRIVSYLAAGLRRRERVVFHGAPAERSELMAERLSARGTPVARLVASGRLSFGSAEDTYLAGGGFDPDRQVREHAAAVRSAVRDGLRGLRVAADLAWLSRHPGALVSWAAYELRADLLAARLPFGALCAYDATHWTPDDLALIEAVHSLSLRPTGTGVRVHAHRDGSIRISGELDLAYADRLRAALVGTVAHAGSPVLDVTDLTFVDLAGLRTLLAAARAMAAAKGSATIRGATPALRRIWHLAEFDRVDPAVRVE
jgi:anti-anti-sigma factor